MTSASSRRLGPLAALAELLMAACSGKSSRTCAAARVPGTCAADCGRHDTATAGICSDGLLCCTPATAAACDSSAMPQPNAGLVEEAGDTGCPLAMALVAAATPFCIDRYEASLALTATDESWSPYWNPDANAVRAVSLRNAVPQAYLSGTQAAAACAAAGKRLCTDDEWLRACQGPGGFTWPYGNAWVTGNCNDARAVHPAIELFGTSDAWIWSFLDHPCLDQLPASLGKTGARTICVTTEGVHDMTGNLAEWTSDPGGTLRGGDYVTGPLDSNGAGCQNLVTAHAATYDDFSTGFRCCADAP